MEAARALTTRLERPQRINQLLFDLLPLAGHREEFCATGSTECEQLWMVMGFNEAHEYVGPLLKPARVLHHLAGQEQRAVEVAQGPQVVGLSRRCGRHGLVEVRSSSVD